MSVNGKIYIFQNFHMTAHLHTHTHTDTTEKVGAYQISLQTEQAQYCIDAALECRFFHRLC